MGPQESLIGTTSKTAGRKVPVLGIAIGAAQTAKQARNARKALYRAVDTKRTEQERVAASRAATIYGRRAIFRATSTIVSQIPVYGTVTALALDGADAVLNTVEGDPVKVEKTASQNNVTKKKNTEKFMREMREQAAKESLRENNQAHSIKH